jgi:hypothetical protein
MYSSEKGGLFLIIWPATKRAKKQKLGFVSSYMYLELNEKLKIMMTQNVGSVLGDVHNKLNKTWRKMFLF